MRRSLSSDLCPKSFVFLHKLKPQGGTCQNFDRDARPIFLGLKFGQILFFGLANFLPIFLGFAKFPLYFWV